MMQIWPVAVVEQVISITDQMQSDRKEKTYKVRENPFNLFNDEQLRLKYGLIIFMDQLFGSTIPTDKRGGGLSFFNNFAPH